MSVQDRCMVCARHAIGSKSLWTQSMVPLGDEAQVEARFGPFEHCANLDARQVHDLRRVYHRLINCFGRNRKNS